MLLDILYLDEPWLRSLASQREGDLRGRTVHSSGGKSAGKEPASGTWSEVQEGTSETAELGVLDDRFVRFLAVANNSIIRLDDSNVDREAPTALLSGAFVTASGAFFYDDFGAMANMLKDTAEMVGLKSKMDAAKSEIVAQALGASKHDLSGRQKKAVSQEEYKQKLQASAVKATSKGTEAQYKALAEMVEAVLKTRVECGVSLGENPREAKLVRAVLDNSHIRPNAAFIFDRFGARTRAPFTVIGTVCRVGWQEQLHLSDAEEAAAAAGEGDTVKEVPNEPMTTFRQGQTVVQKVRRQMFAAGDERSVFLVPLAVFRPIPITWPDDA